MRTIITIIVLTLCSLGLYSQSLLNRVVASGGDYSESSSYRISYTVGDVMTYSFMNQNTLFTTGFQQNWDITVGVDQITGELKVVAYPNPVSDKLTIRFGLIEYPSLAVELLTVTGIRLFFVTIEGPLSEEVKEFDISHLNSGVYILRISNSEKNAIKTIKLIKR